ncbi:MAG: zonular occludens toxin domain-containing protein [Candidatus Paceibacterota bacterium]
MITLHAGKLGQGKSYWATREVWKTINRGIDCYVNWRIDFDAYFARERRGWRGFLWKWWNRLTFGNEKIGKVYYWENFDDLYKIRQGELFFDEAHQELNSRKWADIPKEFVKKLTLSRHYHLNMHFISQHQGQVDVIVRRLANYFTRHYKFWFLFIWKEWDGEAIEILANPAMPKPKSMGFGVHLFDKVLAGCYNSFWLPGEKEEYKQAPMWSEDSFIQKRSILKSLKLNKNNV